MISRALPRVSVTLPTYVSTIRLCFSLYHTAAFNLVVHFKIASSSSNQADSTITPYISGIVV